MRTNLIWILAWVVYGILVAGCGESDPPAVEPPEVSLGITAACPLCVGHEIEVTNRTPTSGYEEQTYYFCSTFCKKAFDRDPAKALAKHAAATQVATTQAGTTQPATTQPAATQPAATQPGRSSE